jgi:hypothetical protein
MMALGGGTVGRAPDGLLGDSLGQHGGNGRPRHVQPKDAVHVASALYARCEHLDTSDGGMAKHSGQLGSTPTLMVRPPDLPAQPDLFPPTEQP